MGCSLFVFSVIIHLGIFRASAKKVGERGTWLIRMTFGTITALRSCELSFPVYGFERHRNCMICLGDAFVFDIATSTLFAIAFTKCFNKMVWLINCTKKSWQHVLNPSLPKQSAVDPKALQATVTYLRFFCPKEDPTRLANAHPFKSPNTHLQAHWRVKFPSTCVGICTHQNRFPRPLLYLRFTSRSPSSCPRRQGRTFLGFIICAGEGQLLKLSNMCCGWPETRMTTWMWLVRLPLCY